MDMMENKLPGQPKINNEGSKYSDRNEVDHIPDSERDAIDQKNSLFGIGVSKGTTNIENLSVSTNENVEGNAIQVQTQQLNIYQQKSCKTKKRQVDRLVITLNGIGFDKFLQDPEIQKALSLLLQKASGDTSVNFEKIEEGSIKITLNGSPEGLKRLADLIESGALGEDLENLGLSVEDVKRIAPEATEENENAEENDVKLSPNQSAIVKEEAQATEEIQQPLEQLQREGKAVRKRRRVSIRSTSQNAIVGGDRTINTGGGNYNEPIGDDYIQDNKGDTINQSNICGVGFIKGENVSVQNVRNTINESQDEIKQLIESLRWQIQALENQAIRNEAQEHLNNLEASINTPYTSEKLRDCLDFLRDYFGLSLDIKDIDEG